MTDIAAMKDRLKAAYQEWNDTRGGSVDTWMAIMHENVAFGSLAEGQEPVPFTAPCCNRDDLKRYFEGLLEGWTMIHYTVDELVAEGDRIVAIGSTAWTSKATGKTVDTRKVDVWQFRDGQAIECYEYYDTAQIVVASS